MRDMRKSKERKGKGMTTKVMRILILILLAIFMIIVLDFRGQYVFGGESLIFFGYAGWAIYATINGIDLGGK